jgi:uncharacterized metal-binding protein YceD (DUF177 family)
MMTVPDLPYSEPIRLHQIGAGQARLLEPDAAARARIVRALDLASLDSLTAELTVEPAAIGWAVKGRLRATLAQTCGITLDPLPMDVDQTFRQTFAETPDEDSDEVVVTLDDESPDLLEDGFIDLGQVVVEQLSLQLDPFPRKPGAAFVQPPEPTEISPFAVLKGLKPTGEG